MLILCYCLKKQHNTSEGTRKWTHLHEEGKDGSKHDSAPHVHGVHWVCEPEAILTGGDGSAWQPETVSLCQQHSSVD